MSRGEHADDDHTDEEKAELDRRADEVWEGEALTFDEWKEQDG